MQNFFKRQKLNRHTFLSAENYIIQNEYFTKSKSTPEIKFNFSPESSRIFLKNTFKMYSDVYFKMNQPLFGYKIDSTQVFYACNSVKIYSKLYNNISYEYLPIFQHSFLNIYGLLLDLSYFRFEDSHKLLSKPNQNTKLFKNYVPAVIYNHNTDDSINYYPLNDYNYRNSHKYSKTYEFKVKKQKVFVDLDEISPVENENITISSPKLTKFHNKKTLDKMEHKLIEQKRINMKLQTEKNVFLLEPLLLENVLLNKVGKEKLTLTEHKKIVRLTIFYTLAFFALALVTFFIIYLA